MRDKRRRMEEAQRHGRSGEDSSSDDEDEGDDEHEQLKLEAPKPSNLNQEKLSLPSRPRASSNSMAEP